MELDPREVKDGYRWLVGAGLFAVLLCIFLIKSDDFLSNWDREKRLGETLKELRTAQTSLPSSVTDPRVISQ